MTLSGKTASVDSKTTVGKSDALLDSTVHMAVSECMENEVHIS